jgi:hypothetical protein
VRRLSIATLAALLLLGCTATGTKNVAGDYQPAPAMGVLVASVSAGGYVPGELWFQVVRAGAPDQVAASILVNDSGADPVNGRLAVVELPPGRYEVRRWVMNEGNRDAYSSRRPLGHHFDIRAGKATYIGHVRVDIQRSAGRGLPFRITVDDRSARDLPQLRTSHPRIPADSVTVAIAEAGVEPRPEAAAPGGTRLEDLQGLLPRR